jgi:hypothetical protein
VAKRAVRTAPTRLNYVRDNPRAVRRGCDFFQLGRQVRGSGPAIQTLAKRWDEIGGMRHVAPRRLAFLGLGEPSRRRCMQIAARY